MQWGDNILYSHGTHHSAGVMILFNRFSGKVISHLGDKEGHWLIAAIDLCNQKIIVLSVYGYNNKVLNRNMLEKLGRMVNEWKAAYLTDKIIIGGDFNIIPNSWMDKIPIKGQQPEINDILHNFCAITGTFDYWRFINPTVLEYTWFSASTNNLRSRLDYWLISHSIGNNIQRCEILRSPLTDHCLISLSWEVNKQSHSSNNLWKFNNRLLSNDSFCKLIKELSSEIKKTDMSNKGKWEWFKFETKRLAIETGKKVLNVSKQKQKDILQKLSVLCNKTNASEEELTELNLLQKQLDEMYLEKANGAFVRSRAKWIEEGEKNTSYFYSLEKSRQTKKKIIKITKNDTVLEDQNVIHNEIHTFYSNLYKSDALLEDCETFFLLIKDKIKKIEENDKRRLEVEITDQEIENALKKMNNGKSPGIDGLTSEFF